MEQQGGHMKEKNNKERISVRLVSINLALERAGTSILTMWHKTNKVVMLKMYFHVCCKIVSDY